MYQCIARIKGTESWREVTNMHQPFAGESGIIEYMIDAMKCKYPNIEYKMIPSKFPSPEAHQTFTFNF